MKFFDLSFGEDGPYPKFYKVSNELFKSKLVDFPLALAEKLVEVGYGKWVPITAGIGIPVPQQLTFPEQIFFVKMPTPTVKAVHVNSLVPEKGEEPINLVVFGNSLEANKSFVHDPNDYEDVSFDEDDELYDILEPFPEEEVVEVMDLIINEKPEPLPEEIEEVEKPKAPKSKKK